MYFQKTEVLDLAICVGALSLLIMLVIRELRRVWLARRAHANIPANASDEDAALCLAREIFLSARRKVLSPEVSYGRFDSHPVNPRLVPAGLQIERPGALRDLESVAALHTFYASMLEAIGLQTRRIYLHHPDGEARHCALEIALDDGKLIVDVEFGLSYRDFWGDRLDVDQLRRGLQPWFEPLPGLEYLGLPDERYYEFDFARTTVPEGSQLPRHGAFNFLHGAGRRVLIRWPQTMVRRSRV